MLIYVDFSGFVPSTISTVVASDRVAQHSKLLVPSLDVWYHHFITKISSYLDLVSKFRGITQYLSLVVEVDTTVHKG